MMRRFTREKKANYGFLLFSIIFFQERKVGPIYRHKYVLKDNGDTNYSQIGIN